MIMAYYKTEVGYYQAATAPKPGRSPPAFSLYCFTRGGCSVAENTTSNLQECGETWGKLEGGQSSERPDVF